MFFQRVVCFVTYLVLRNRFHVYGFPLSGRFDLYVFVGENVLGRLFRFEYGRLFLFVWCRVFCVRVKHFRRVWGRFLRVSYLIFVRS